MNTWFEEHSSILLDEFSRLNNDVWIQRINPVFDGDGYSYKSRKISRAEYDRLVRDRQENMHSLYNITDADRYKKGYNAAKILLGMEEP